MARLLFFLMLNASIGYSQSINKVFNFPDQVTSTIAGLTIDQDTIVTIGQVSDTALNHWGIQISKFDTTGALLSYNIYYDSLSRIFIAGDNSGIIKTTDGGYLCTMGIQNSLTAYLFKYTHDLQIEWISGISPSGLFYINGDGIVECENGYVFAGTLQKNNYDSQIFIAKVNKKGELKWLQQFGDGNDHSTRTILKNNENSFFVCGGETSYQSANWARNWIFEVDSLGNKIWETKTAKWNQEGGPFMQMDSTSFYIAAVRAYYTPGLATMVDYFLWKIDRVTGNTVWQKNISLDRIAPYANMAALKLNPVNHGWDIVGTFQYLPNGFVVGGYTAHTDYEGNLLWTRQDTAYLDTGLVVNRNVLSCMGHLSTGSIIAGGNVKKTMPIYHNEAWLLKITSDGCKTTDDCAVVETNEVTETRQDLSIFPNPAGEKISIKISEFIGNEKKSVEILNLFGEVLQTQTINSGQAEIDISRLPDGLVFVQIIEKGKVKAVGKVVIQH